MKKNVNVKVPPPPVRWPYPSPELPEVIPPAFMQPRARTNECVHTPVIHLHTIAGRHRLCNLCLMRSIPVYMYTCSMTVALQ